MTIKKTLYIPLLLMLFPFLSFAQEVIPKEMTYPWFDNQPHEIYGHSITMVYGGTRGGISTYTTDPVTTIAYRSLDEIVEVIKRDKNLNTEEMEGRLSLLEEDAPGGVFYIYITRYNEAAANTYNWYANVSTKDNKTVWKGRLPFSSPNLPMENGWWNFIEVPIPADVKPPFFIYLNPDYGTETYLFGYRIDN